MPPGRVLQIAGMIEDRDPYGLAVDDARVINPTRSLAPDGSTAVAFAIAQRTAGDGSGSAQGGMHPQRKRAFFGIAKAHVPLHRTQLRDDIDRTRLAVIEEAQLPRLAQHFGIVVNQPLV